MSADFSNEHVGDYFTREQKKLVNYVHRLIKDTSEMDAEDIVQDVMLNLFDTADITAPIENLSAYVYRSIYNRVVDRYLHLEDCGVFDISQKGGSVSM